MAWYGMIAVWHFNNVGPMRWLGFFTLITFFTSLLLDCLAFELWAFSSLPWSSLSSKYLNLARYQPFQRQKLNIIYIITFGLRTPFLSYTMATEWSLDFCLVCDRQTLGAPYCSQTCRLAELDEVSDGMSRRSSAASTHWSEINQAQAQAEGVNTDTHNPSRMLSASSSQTSLSSLKSNTSTSSNVADRLQDELRDYASCFDQVRDLKRRMTTTWFRLQLEFGLGNCASRIHRPTSRWCWGYPNACGPHAALSWFAYTLTQASLLEKIHYALVYFPFSVFLMDQPPTLVF